ncbi:MAG TPA: MG2 domain-containing protein [Ferruginibacter sp.]|nr:MG2 domain-containing protein [Ferruginibacter sp.]HMP21038.1 MG2 domain-containing protein [Ferruginibacter sp.]
MKKFALLLAVILMHQFALSQTIQWDDLESRIDRKYNLTELTTQLEKIKQEAALNGNDIVVARCFFMQMKVEDVKNEDTLYFMNASFMDSIIAANKNPLMQAMMHLLKAKRIGGFRSRFLFRGNKNLFKLPRGVPDYRLLTGVQLDSVINSHFEIARQFSYGLTRVDANTILWLTKDPLLFLFKPVFTDIIYAEQLHYADAIKGYTFNPGASWLLMSPDSFITSKQLPPGLNTSFEHTYKLYSDWAAFNREASKKFYFIESLARKFFFQMQGNEMDSAGVYFENYLLQLRQSPYSAVKAHAVFQLCLLWKSRGEKYADFYKVQYANNYASSAIFDTTYRWYFKKAVELFDANNKVFDSFAYLRNSLLLQKAFIQEKKISFITQAYHLPGGSIEGRIFFKNTSAIHIRIIKRWAFDDIKLLTRADTLRLMQHAAYKDTIINLPLQSDFQIHAAKIVLPGMPAGNYAILFSDSFINNNTGGLRYCNVYITNIAGVNADKRLFILHRKTGMPLNGATVKFLLPKKNNHINGLKPLIQKVNASGYIDVHHEDVDDILAIYGNDTTLVTFNKPNNSLPYEVYDKEDDELIDYYADNMVMHLFTDRAIYRPGQTVYFKGILLTRNPKTGEMMLVNKKNLRFPLFKKLFNDEVKETLQLVKQKLEVFVEDPFGRTVDTVKVKLNEFGAISGMYKLKPNAPTGEWSFDIDFADMDGRNEGKFKVEEYKRPSFELVLEKPGTFLQLGDSFFIKAKTRSFAGMLLSGVAIDYTIHVRFDKAIQSLNINAINTAVQNFELADTTGITDINGELLIPVSSTLLNNFICKDERGRCMATYSIEAEATDATGESHEATLELRLSNQPVTIEYKLARIYERSALGKIAVNASNDFSGLIVKTLEAKIYRVQKSFKSSLSPAAEDYRWENHEWVYGVKKIESHSATDIQKELVYTTLLKSGTDKLTMPADLLPAGNYQLEISCTENGSLLGVKQSYFDVFDKKTSSFPGNDFYYLPVNSGKAGERLQWYSGTREDSIYSILHVQYYSNASGKLKPKHSYTYDYHKNGVINWAYMMPRDAVGKISISHIYIHSNQLHIKNESLYSAASISDETEIIVEQYRKNLSPGTKETFTVRITTGNEKTVAELMSVMYDASLDKIEPHKWTMPYNNYQYAVKSHWPYSINQLTNTGYGTQPLLYHYNWDKDSKMQPLWWLNPLDYAYNMLGSRDTKIAYSNEMLEGRLSGISIAADALQDVVVIGYGTAVAKSMTGSVVTIRGAASISGNNAPLIVLDGVLFEGDISAVKPEQITDAVVLKGADATGLYGARASNGVIILSTSGKVRLPEPEKPHVVVRKNFAETAFFQPHIYADANGIFNIIFDIPESVTEWNWKLLAHTKKAGFVYAERKIVTQLPLMIQPNMPRFLYEGDSISIQSRISNLDSLPVSGASFCKVEDMVTGEDITASVTQTNKQAFTVAGNTNASVMHSVHIPGGLLHPVKIRITAATGNFSDGEEYIVPVLSRKILASQTIPFHFSGKADSVMAMPRLPAGAIPVGAGLYIEPKPQKALLDALPYLAFYPYNCAEQTFNKVFAHCVAVQLLQVDTIAQQLLTAINLKTEQQHPKALPGELAENEMPWLQLANKEFKQQQQLQKVLDTTEGKRLAEKYIKELEGLQKTDGGMSWFRGGSSSIYISYYLLGGFGKMGQNGLLNKLHKTSQDVVEKMIKSLIAYADNTFANQQENAYSLQYLLSRKYWLNQYPLNSQCSKKADSVLTVCWRDADGYTLNRQAQLIVVTLEHSSYESLLYKKAMALLESIRQLAINDQNGLRWKDMSNTDDFSTNDEETMALLFDAFLIAGDTHSTNAGLIKWLLGHKQQHSWQTTKATAAVIGVLQQQQGTTVNRPANISAGFTDSTLSVTNNILNGNTTAFTYLKALPGTVVLKATKGEPAPGGVLCYYFSDNPADASAVVKMNRKIYRISKSGQQELLEDGAQVQVADKLKTIITIETTRPLQYVFINEKRSAMQEPADGSSGYEYTGGLGYYKAVRDAGYQFFAEKIPSGSSSIEYETIVAKEGSFWTGITSLECMYQPMLKAYTQGIRIYVVKAQ